MTVTLDLKADEARVLQEIARSAETTIEAVLHALIVQVSASYSLPPRSAEAESAEAESAEAESAEAESAEAESAEAESAEAESAEAESRREQEEVEANIRRWHAERAAL